MPHVPACVAFSGAALSRCSECFYGPCRPRQSEVNCKVENADNGEWTDVSNANCGERVEVWAAQPHKHPRFVAAQTSKN